MRTKLAMLVCYAVLLIGTPVHGEEVFYCTDTAGQGFVWENDVVQPSSFTPDSFFMKIAGESRHGTLRELMFDSGKEYFACDRPAPHEPNLETCINYSSGYSGMKTFVFKGTQYTSSFLYGGNVGGDRYITVRYGTCT